MVEQAAYVTIEISSLSEGGGEWDGERGRKRGEGRRCRCVCVGVGGREEAERNGGYARAGNTTPKEAKEHLR